MHYVSRLILIILLSALPFNVNAQDNEQTPLLPGDEPPSQLIAVRIPQAPINWPYASEHLPASRKALLVVTHLGASGVAATGTFLISKGVLEQQLWLTGLGSGLVVLGESFRIASDGFHATHGIIPQAGWCDRAKHGLFKTEYIASYCTRFFSGILQPSQVVLPTLLNHETSYGVTLTGLVVSSILDLTCINHLAQKLRVMTGAIQGG